jgi:hypothetical protein
MRLQQRRVADFRHGQGLGHEDHVVPWTKPKQPAWMDEATSTALPASIEMRELQMRVTQRGFRTHVVLVATIWPAAKVCTKEALAGLYRARWQADYERR